jgi:hypothetical protein
VRSTAAIAAALLTNCSLLPACVRARACARATGPHPCRLRHAEYFSQFGRVTKLRLSRSKKSGKSKHYGFLEFASAEVAQIAAEAMDGYMLFTQKLTARVMAKEEVHADLFKGANRVFKKVRQVAGWHNKYSTTSTAANVCQAASHLLHRDFCARPAKRHASRIQRQEHQEQAM